MSFSADVKDELIKHRSETKHCKTAELAAIIYHCGKCSIKDEHFSLTIQSENEDLMEQCTALLKDLFGLKKNGTDYEFSRQNGTYKVYMGDESKVLRVLQTTKMNQPEEYFEAWKERYNSFEINKVSQKKKQGKKIVRFEKDTRCCDMQYSDKLIESPCCKRAFLKGSFLAIGSMSDPEKSYHLEFVCSSEQQGKQIQKVMRSFDIEAKIVIRKKYFILYIKEGESIVDLLNVIEAHKALMDFENLRIVKEMRNSINRRVNCEAANITKTVNAASKQVEDILLIQEHGGLYQLPANLLQIAELRLENPDLSLKDLGALAEPPIGKSGVNHRLRKISEFAEGLRFESE